MKHLHVLVLALAFLVLPAFAGDCCVSGTDCANQCPLAQQANARLATGTEALPVSKTIRHDFVKTVLENLEAI
jgi:hypothetical protein